MTEREGRAGEVASRGERREIWLRLGLGFCARVLRRGKGQDYLGVHPSKLGLVRISHS